MSVKIYYGNYTGIESTLPTANKDKNASTRFGFGTFSLEKAEMITCLLIRLKVPFECE